MCVTNKIREIRTQPRAHGIESDPLRPITANGDALLPLPPAQTVTRNRLCTTLARTPQALEGPESASTTQFA